MWLLIDDAGEGCTGRGGGGDESGEVLVSRSASTVKGSGELGKAGGSGLSNSACSACGSTEAKNKGQKHVDFRIEKINHGRF
jgi:hypothetical protein